MIDSSAASELWAVLVDLQPGDGCEDLDFRAEAIRRTRNRVRTRILELDPSRAGDLLMAHEAPRPQVVDPAWTTTPPSEEGFYWWRRERNGSIEKEVVRIGSHGGIYFVGYAGVAEARDVEGEFSPVKLEPPP